MSVINSVGGLIGVVIGASFLLVGGIVLPLWQISQDRHHHRKAQS